MAGYVFRTDGPWGTGKGSNLTPDEVDGNFWQATQDIAAKAIQGVGIQDIIVVGNQLTFMLTDHTLLGPYTLPTAHYSFRGAWAPSTTYFVNDIFTDGGATYAVLVNHVSGLTFDPNATDGLGHNLYGLMLAQPDAILPTGGAVGMFLRKATSADFSVAWQTATIEDLSDVAVTSPTAGQVLTYSGGTWVNSNVAAAIPWDFGFSFMDEPAVGATIQVVPITRNITIPANLVGSVGFVGTPPDAIYEVDVLVNGVLKATILYHVDGTITFATSGGTAIDVLAGSTIAFVTSGADSPSVTGISEAAVTILASLT